MRTFIETKISNLTGAAHQIMNHGNDVIRIRTNKELTGSKLDFRLFFLDWTNLKDRSCLIISDIDEFSAFITALIMGGVIEGNIILTIYWKSNNFLLFKLDLSTMLLSGTRTQNSLLIEVYFVDVRPCFPCHANFGSILNSHRHRIWFDGNSEAHTIRH